VKTASINSNQVFWVDVDGNTGRGKGDLQLYTRDFSQGRLYRRSVGRVRQLS
jgi:hypothetical protein